MGKYFSDPVEQALRYIYYQDRQGKGKEGFRLLEEAAAAGDVDASYFLARCLCGSQYVWSGHGFPEDEERATQLLHQTVEQGSAMAALTCLRTGDMTPSLEKKMPFASLQEAFQIVLDKAERGEPFCQYVIGNVYFWGDFIRIEGKGAESFPSKDAFRDYVIQNISKCEDWFIKAYRGGVHFAGNNLNSYYTKGEPGLIPPQPEKAEGLFRIGAEGGHPLHQYFWAQELEKAGKKEEALRWYREAAEGGKVDCWYNVGKAYELGEGAPQDYAYAVRCYERALNDPNSSVGSHNRLGSLYYEGKGVPQDYAKAYQLISWAYQEGKTSWSLDYLGKCCFYGRGTQQDYQKAREYLEQIDWNDWEVSYLLGCIYARGLGVPADIKKGVEYLQKAGNHPEAKEELLRYKKTLFGKWVQR